MVLSHSSSAGCCELTSLAPVAAALVVQRYPAHSVAFRAASVRCCAPRRVLLAPMSLGRLHCKYKICQVGLEVPEGGILKSYALKCSTTFKANEIC